jgi:hypothetical protein
MVNIMAAEDAECGRVEAEYAAALEMLDRQREHGRAAAQRRALDELVARGWTAALIAEHRTGIIDVLAAGEKGHRAGDAQRARDRVR